MGLFTKIFGSKSSNNSETLKINELLDGTIQRANLDISFDVENQKDDNGDYISINFYGNDEELFTSKDGALLDAFQLFLKRALQNASPEDNTKLIFDCNGFREKANQSLVELAEKLKNRAIDQNKSVYLRALPPKDRKIVHQFLANDDRVKSRSVGDGLYKKIKIYPNTKKDGESANSAH